MVDYESKQVASWWYALAGVIALSGVFPIRQALTESGESIETVLAILFGVFVVAVVVASFASLTVRVSDDELCFGFNRLFRRRIPLSDLRAVEVRRNPWYWGYGLRWTPKGWLWRSRGTEAVWVTLESQKQIGIGAPDPEALRRAIRERSPGL